MEGYTVNREVACEFGEVSGVTDPGTASPNPCPGINTGPGLFRRPLAAQIFNVNSLTIHLRSGRGWIDLNVVNRDTSVAFSLRIDLLVCDDICIVHGTWRAVHSNPADMARKALRCSASSICFSGFSGQFVYTVVQ